jgi:hypothetical protein
MAVPTSRTKILGTQVAESGTPLRPIITYINGDIAWLISFPRPESDKNKNGKIYYHVVIDPWFGKPAKVLSSLVLVMRPGRDPSIANRASLDAAILEIEAAAGHSLIESDVEPAVDAIFIMGMAADHCHKESLIQFSTTTPVFAVPVAARSITQWKHFKSVVTMSSCDPNKTPWREAHPGSPLPSWLTAFPPTVNKFNNFGLVLITSANPSQDEMILIAPHGISADEPSLKAFEASTNTSVKMLALIAPLKDSYTFGLQTVLGIKDGLSIAVATKTKYYIRSGDFVSLEYAGFLSYFVRDEPRDLQWGIDALGEKDISWREAEQPAMIEVENGGSFVMA